MKNLAIVMRGFTKLFIEKLGRLLDFGLGKWLNTVSSAESGHPSRSLGENSAESNVEYRDATLMVSEGNNNSNWARDHSCVILVKAVIGFCPCSENVSNVKMKNCGLI